MILRKKFAGTALIAALALAVPATANHPSTYQAKITPLNGSMVKGVANLKLDGDMLKLNLNVNNLEMNQPHAAHIHGFMTTASTCPTMAADTDEDGYVELLEGGALYGGILQTIAGDIDPDGDGNSDFSMTYDLSSVDGLPPLEGRHIVIHGLTLPDGTAGRENPEVGATTGYEALLPIACGEIVAKGTKFNERTPPGR